MKMTFQEIDAKVVELRLIESQIKSLEAARDSIKSDLKSVLDETQLDMLDTGLNKLWYKPTCKKVVDVDKLRSSGLYEDYSKDQISLMFRITN